MSQFVTLILLFSAFSGSAMQPRGSASLSARPRELSFSSNHPLVLCRRSLMKLIAYSLCKVNYYAWDEPSKPPHPQDEIPRHSTRRQWKNPMRRPYQYHPSGHFYYYWLRPRQRWTRLNETGPSEGASAQDRRVPVPDVIEDEPQKDSSTTGKSETSIKDLEIGTSKLNLEDENVPDDDEENETVKTVEETRLLGNHSKVFTPASSPERVEEEPDEDESNDVKMSTPRPHPVGPKFFPKSKNEPEELYTFPNLSEAGGPTYKNKQIPRTENHSEKKYLEYQESWKSENPTNIEGNSQNGGTGNDKERRREHEPNALRPNIHPGENPIDGTLDEVPEVYRGRTPSPVKYQTYPQYSDQQEQDKHRENLRYPEASLYQHRDRNTQHNPRRDDEQFHRQNEIPMLGDYERTRQHDGQQYQEERGTDSKAKYPQLSGDGDYESNLQKDAGERWTRKPEPSGNLNYESNPENGESRQQGQEDVDRENGQEPGLSLVDYERDPQLNGAKDPLQVNGAQQVNQEPTQLNDAQRIKQNPLQVNGDQQVNRNPPQDDEIPFVEYRQPNDAKLVNQEPTQLNDAQRIKQNPLQLNGDQRVNQNPPPDDALPFVEYAQPNGAQLANQKTPQLNGGAQPQNEELDETDSPGSMKDQSALGKNEEKPMGEWEDDVKGNFPVPITKECGHLLECKESSQVASVVQVRVVEKNCANGRTRSGKCRQRR